MNPILTPSENILSASQLLSTCLTPGNNQGKRYNKRLFARVVKAAKGLQILPQKFEAAFVGLVLDHLGNQYLIFIPESFTTTLDSLSAVSEHAVKTNHLEREATAKQLSAKPF